MDKSQASNSFSVSRTVLFYKRLFEMNRKSQGYTLAIVVGILLIFWFLPILFGTSKGVAWHQYDVTKLTSAALFLFTLTGLIFSSSIFDEIHKPGTATLQMMLPVKSSEKFIGAWLITSVSFVLFYIAVFSLLYIAIQTVTFLTQTTSFTFRPFNPLDPDILSAFGSYFYYNAIFLLGAVVFRGYNFLKTLFCIIAAVLLIVITAGLTLFIFSGSGSFSFTAEDIPLSIRHVISFTIMLTFLFLGWWRLKNRQVA